MYKKKKGKYKMNDHKTPYFYRAKNLIKTLCEIFFCLIGYHRHYDYFTDIQYIAASKGIASRRLLLWTKFEYCTSCYKMKSTPENKNLPYGWKEEVIYRD